ncbi:hypothetical protein [Pseudomonas sp. dw_358]|uniref:hypothetical protein n=1 Tax=Pseudomonas sp. dw_358 TaxID=2720083 RepID=UPI001BD5EC26|nr:hypothetical protein [Pseudomonas sp. dw_358]
MKTLLVVVLLMVAGCTPNAPFRSLDKRSCPAEQKGGCGVGFYETHPRYDLGFVEYTERGNDFYPERTNALLAQIKTYANSDGVAIIVFVHGWRHNAAEDDANVQSFNEALATIAQLDILGPRKLVGVYVGWRGLTLHGLQSEALTYWDRKATAEQVGRAGVTQLLLNLEHIDRSDTKNLMLTVGHSFGGALVLSALNNVLLDRMVSAQYGQEVKSFGNGVILLNPAIEADKGLALKENSLKLGLTGVKIPGLLYVVSSEGDMATTTPFRLGQDIGTNLIWSQVGLHRRYGHRDYVLDESQLDNTTVGNYAPFWTDRLTDLAQPSASGLGTWQHSSYCAPPATSDRPVQLPCTVDEPMAVFRVPATFIKDHNDVFNTNVISLIATIASKSLRDDQLSSRLQPTNQVCLSQDRFDFGKCFNHFFGKARALKEQQASVP